MNSLRLIRLPALVLSLAVLLLTSCGEEVIPPDPLFRLVEGSDLPALGATYGGTFLDVNADGLLDLLMADPALEATLFLNDGRLGFTKAAAGQYRPLTGSVYHGGAACDFDNDGDWDVFVTTDTDAGRWYGRNHLWVQETTGVFSDRGVDDPVLSDPIGRGQGGLWADFDDDRRPELLVFNYQSPALLADRSTGQWRAVTDRLPWPPPVKMDSSGPPPAPRIRARSGWVHTGLAADLDRDGQQDLLAIGRPGWAGLLWNSGQGELRERTSASGLKHALWPKSPREVAMGDLNGDGQPDLAFCYHTADEFTRIYTPLEIWLNESKPGAPKFVMERFVGEDDGKPALLKEVYKPEGSILADLDNDGNLDLYVVQPARVAGLAPNLLYQGHGDGTFADVTAAWGGAGPPDSAPESAWAVDFDHDGDLDLLTFNGGDPLLETSLHRGVALYENLGAVGLNLAEEGQTIPLNRGLTLHLVSRTGPPHGLGAEATLSFGEQTRTVWQHSRISGASSAILPLHFGVGREAGPYLLQIRWESGTVQEFRIPEAGCAYVISEGEAGITRLAPRAERGSQ